MCRKMDSIFEQLSAENVKNVSRNSSALEPASDPGSPSSPLPRSAANRGVVPDNAETCFGTVTGVNHDNDIYELELDFGTGDPIPAHSRTLEYPTPLEVGDQVKVHYVEQEDDVNIGY